MKRLIYRAAAHNTLMPDGRDGPVVHGGETFEVPDDRAEELLTAPHYICELVEDLPTPESRELERHTRPELDEMAREVGVPSPDQMRSKADVAEAILAMGEEAETEPEPTKEPEAEDGEGQTTSTDEGGLTYGAI